MSHVFVPTPSPDRGLTTAQKRALLALRREAEADAAAVAEAAGMKPNGAGLALRGLERRGLVARQDGEPAVWTVTFAGHALVERLAGSGSARR
ncbi:MAG TPA: helix-turn-helix domain-containing protein [Solirubrobacteraceae bacterium]|jgi:DNA-binding MarR family transcriptional regulator